MTATSMTYLGTPASVTAARRSVRAILADSPRVDDLELIATELMTNAIRHTPSGRDGGRFTITVHRAPGMARIEVEDDGSGHWNARPLDGTAECGRGLILVMALAEEVGYEITQTRTQIAWAGVAWPASC
jgi:anti-sigma regulatory factor (Ser/Thr protein kinase)